LSEQLVQHPISRISTQTGRQNPYSLSTLVQELMHKVGVNSLDSPVPPTLLFPPQMGL
jgi:hypothetical protein